MTLKLLLTDGKLTLKDGKLVVTQNAAECECCGEALTCLHCCAAGTRQFATVTVTGVTGPGCCGDWNATWELSLVQVDNGDGTATCYWELLDGCGTNPRIDIAIGTCIDGLQLISIRFANDRTTIPYVSATFDHIGFASPIDCDTFWDTSWNFTYSGNNGTGCNFTAATVTVVFHD